MKLILGTAQMGFEYGITNATGQPDVSCCIDIIKYAVNNGINILDTARDYGSSEKIIGTTQNSLKNIEVITKLSNFQVNKHDSSYEIYDSIEKSIKTSMLNLKICELNTFLLHTYKHYENNIIWNYLKDEKNHSHKIAKLGVSIYMVDEAIKLLKDDDVKHIQIPINLLDDQWDNHDFLTLAKKRNDVTIHCRSIFLQGILVSDASKWPKSAKESNNYVKQLDILVETFKLNNKIELCFSYIKYFDWVDGIVIGVDNIGQLQNNIECFKVRKLTHSEFLHVRKVFRDVPLTILDPRCW
jgi:aryl-alcohol dehydrogenase-like predicted oxidoreductase